MLHASMSQAASPDWLWQCVLLPELQGREHVPSSLNRRSRLDDLRDDLRDGCSIPGTTIPQAPVVLEAWFADNFLATAVEESDHTMFLRILPRRLFRHVPELNVVARREERL